MQLFCATSFTFLLVLVVCLVGIISGLEPIGGVMAEGIKLGIRISKELDARLKRIELATGLSRGDLVRNALSQIIPQAEKHFKLEPSGDTSLEPSGDTALEPIGDVKKPVFDSAKAAHYPDHVRAQLGLPLADENSSVPVKKSKNQSKRARKKKK